MDCPILAATDFSENAALALDRGAQIAKAQGARLHLLHVVEQEIWTHLAELLGMNASSEHDQLHDQLRADLCGLAATVRDKWQVETDTEIRTGPASKEMIAASRSVNAVLQVMGGHGAGTLHDLATGSTAERLLRQAAIPTLIVNHPVKEPYKKILLPVDFSDWSLLALRLVCKLFPDAEIVLLHVVCLSYEPQLRHAGVSSAEIDQYRAQERQKAETEMAVLLADVKDCRDKISTRVTGGDISTTVVDVAREENVDLVAIGKHGRGMIEEWLLGSVTLHVLASAPCDVLVCGKT